MMPDDQQYDLMMRARPEAPEQIELVESDGASRQISSDELRVLIAEAAYLRSEARGFEPGHELEDWLAAEQGLLDRLIAGST